MVKTILRSALIACVVVIVIGGAVAADSWVTPSWLTDVTTNYYAWTTWGGVPGLSPYVVTPDVTTGSGTGSATVTIDENAAGLLAGSQYAIGSVSSYLELGPTGSIHLDVTPNPEGMQFWVTAVYHEDMTAAPAINVTGASLVRSRTTTVEDTSLDPSLPSQWTLYEALWMLNPNDVGTFAGIDIVADPGAGSNIAQVTVHTGFVPEPSSVLAFMTGLIGFAGIVLRRRP